VVRIVAERRGVPPAQVALAWPAVTAPIVGATELRHVEDALAAVTIALSPDEVALLEARTDRTACWAIRDPVSRDACAGGLGASRARARPMACSP
jgi:diketogulonate reductase-like aldo/keto reductase